MPRPRRDSGYERQLAAERRIGEALRTLEPSLRRKPHFVGFGVGRKFTAGVEVDGLAAVLYVSRKVAAGKLRARDRLPRTVRVAKTSVPTDVVEISFELAQGTVLGSGSANSAQVKIRPVKMGLAIAVCDPPPPQADPNRAKRIGTAGAVVKDGTGTRCVLSAGHLFEIKRNVVIQPTGGMTMHGPPLPGQAAPNSWLDQHETIGGVIKSGYPNPDAGIAECSDSVTEINLIGSPAGPQTPVVDMGVEKSGATTGLTLGRIIATGVTLHGGLTSNAFEVLPLWGDHFADHGDSGALVVVDPYNYGQTLNGDLDDAIRKKGAQGARAFTAKWNRAAVGLLVQMGNRLVNVPGHPGLGRGVTTGLCLDIDVVLAAMKATLVV
jgi:hypothetical protein